MSNSQKVYATKFSSPAVVWLDKPVSAFWTSLCFSLLFCGYPLVSFVPDFLPVKDRQAAVAFRAVCFLLSFVIAIKEFRNSVRKGHQPLSVWFVIGAAFWVAYLGRILSDDSMVAGIGPLPIFDFLAYSFGISAMTLLSMTMVRDPMQLRHAPVMCVTISSVVCALASYFGLENYTAEMAGRLFANDRLNPILLGHSAVVMFVGAAWMLLRKMDDRNVAAKQDAQLVSRRLRSVGLLVVNICLMAMGLYTLVLSSSRSPVIALLICLVLLMVWMRRHAVLLMLLIFVAALVFMQSNMLSSLTGAGLDTERMTRSVVLTDDYMQGGRIDLYAEAFAKFLQSPIWGKSLFNDSMTYPHNLIIETLMALGLLGGALLIAMLLVGFRCLVIASKHSSIGQWLLLVFIHSFVATMTSGAIFYDPMMWTTLGVSLGLSSRIHHRPFENRPHRRESAPSRVPGNVGKLPRAV